MARTNATSNCQQTIPYTATPGLAHSDGERCLLAALSPIVRARHPPLKIPRVDERSFLPMGSNARGILCGGLVPALPDTRSYREVTVRNIELKVRCPDDASLDAMIAQARAGGATYARTLVQRDTYFAAPRGRLKLREWHQPAPAGAAGPMTADAEAEPSGATLIAYSRPDDVGSRVSDYLLSPALDPTTLLTALDRALGIRVVVEKERLLYMWGHTRIHFDRVAGLGAFVELETLIDRFPIPDQSADPLVTRQGAAETEHRAVIAALDLATLPAIAGSYSDLLLAGEAERA
ncbi:MAG: hypothetical protein AVDCRST_MAG18-2929 [uncultured Thermomicrobiales bacterium]|uniref:CYTH domain-containing protein n=1 Tax=uncultured Thermomicrobiales bacterium TaxID=1645740 RepID=A0A6J4VIX8_9BACT|nr:MAG: hypothetical protein AVDCRST_MAG18-2929 [uncultured Thermomicrobiales bacterium]